MKYLKRFSKVSDYESFKGGREYVTPNISFIDDGKRVYSEKKVNKEVNLITFTIHDDYGLIPEGDKTYQAEEGMTWGEWVDSEYNIDSWTLEWMDVVGVFKVKHHYDDYVCEMGMSISSTDYINPESYYQYRA